MFELAADDKEAALGKGARSTSTSAHVVEQTHSEGGAPHQQRGGQPRREERHGLAAPILDRPPPEKQTCTECFG
jgi:hypothetical protein